MTGTPEDVAALWDKERAPWELEPHFSEAMLLLTSKAVFAKSEVATVIANHRATIEAQEEAGRLANISTARAVERAEKAEAVVERLERERDEAKAISQGWELQAGEADGEVERLRAALRDAKAWVIECYETWAHPEFTDILKKGANARMCAINAAISATREEPNGK